MKKLVVEMEIIADGMVHHMPEAFLDLQVLLSANMAVFTLQDRSAVQAIIFFPVVFFHLGAIFRCELHQALLQNYICF